MEKIVIDATPRSPDISFDFENNSFSIRGESYPEDVNEFYGELIEKLEAHLSNLQQGNVNFYFELIYFNSSTAKILMGLFEMLDEAAEQNNTVHIVWAYEEDDDNMEELGEEFCEDLEYATYKLTTIEAQ